MSESSTIQMILDWAEEHPDFDTSFVESLQNSLSKYGSLTSKQMAALENIIYKFQIEDWVETHN